MCGHAANPTVLCLHWELYGVSNWVWTLQKGFPGIVAKRRQCGVIVFGWITMPTIFGVSAISATLSS